MMQAVCFLATALMLTSLGQVQGQTPTLPQPQNPRDALGSPEARTLARLPVSPLASAKRGEAVITIRRTSVVSRNLGHGSHVLRVCRRGEHLTFLMFTKGPAVLVRLASGQSGIVYARDVVPAEPVLGQ